VAERVAVHRGAASGHLGDDAVEAGALADEDVHVALLLHDGLESLGLGLDVEGHLGQVDRVDGVAALGDAEARDPGLGGEALLVFLRRGGGEPAAIAAHDLVHDEHARAGTELGDDVGKELRALLGGSDGAEALANRDDIVVDRLRQADNLERVVVLLEIGGEIGGRGVGVVTADGVEDVDTVLFELAGGDIERGLAFLDQAALEGVLDVGELDAAVADNAAAVVAEDGSLGADFGRDGEASGRGGGPCSRTCSR
jgi:hypothetical protein